MNWQNHHVKKAAFFGLVIAKEAYNGSGSCIKLICKILSEIYVFVLYCLK